MTIDEVINYFGSRTETARKLDVSYQAVQQWAEADKIPKGRQYEIQVLTNGRLKVDLPEKPKAA